MCAFQHVIRHSISVSISCFPSDIFIDFKQAIHSAVAKVFPNAQIRGSRFHLGQSWWRKIQSLGLSKLNNDNADDSHYLKYFFYITIFGA